MQQNETVLGADTQGVELNPNQDAMRLHGVISKLESEQNIVAGLSGGLVAAVVGAGIWAAITVMTGYQIGWMAVGVGFLVGYAVRTMGKGIIGTFGFIGAGCALIGCLLGNVLSTAGFISMQEAIPFMDVVLSVLSQPAFMIDILIATFSPIDLLFYGIAIYQGYKFSFREVTEADLSGVAELNN